MACALLLDARMRKSLSAAWFAVLISACTSSPADDNPFNQNMDDSGKEDSAYMNPDGTEVEVDLEGDVTGSSSEVASAPADLGQFALTYFRKKEVMYIESLAEDASAADRPEWLVN